MPQVTLTEFRDLVVTAPWATFVTIEAETEPSWASKSPKINPHAGKVVKRARVNACIFWYYEKSVNRQRAREGIEDDFVSAPRAWGIRLPGTPFVEYKGNLYLECKVERALGYSYHSRETGEIVGNEEVEPFLKAVNGSGRQGVEKTVIIRDYAMVNIRSIVYCGQTYTLQQEQPLVAV